MPKCGIKFPVYAKQQPSHSSSNANVRSVHIKWEALSEKFFSFSETIAPASSGEKVGHEDDSGEANDCPERDAPAGFLNGFVHGDF
ncbi:hypothetical protein D3C80_395620 [compost metagenome]